MLDQRRRRCTHAIQMFLFAGEVHMQPCTQSIKLEAEGVSPQQTRDDHPMLAQCCNIVYSNRGNLF